MGTNTSIWVPIQDVNIMSNSNCLSYFVISDLSIESNEMSCEENYKNRVRLLERWTTIARRRKLKLDHQTSIVTWKYEKEHRYSRDITHSSKMFVDFKNWC